VNQTQDEYNGLGQLIGEYQSASGAVDTSTTPEVQYAYSDPSIGSQMTEMIYPNGRILHYGYDGNALDDAIGRVDYLADDNGSGGVGSQDVDYSYLGADTIVGQTDGNGVTETITLDGFGRTAEIKYVNSDDVITDDFQYGYDQDGNVLYKANLVDTSLSQIYTYDNLNRLTGYEQGTLNDDDTAISGTPNASQSWTYDALGNQIAVTTNGTTVDNTTNSQNELTEVGSTSQGFDDDGNTLSDATDGDTYTHNAWNQLVGVKNSGNTTIAAYSYLPKGYRITATEGGNTTTSYYLNQWQVIETRQSGNVTTQNVWGIDYVNDLVLRDDNSTSGNLGISGSGLGERLYAEHDANWDVTSIASSSGTVEERFNYTPYGNMTVLTASGSTTTDSYNWTTMFQGGAKDAATGLYQFQRRTYSASEGRWIETDPLGYVNGVSRYDAMTNDPVSKGDPTGLFVTSVHWEMTEEALDYFNVKSSYAMSMLTSNVATDFNWEWAMPTHHAQNPGWVLYVQSLMKDIVTTTGPFVTKRLLQDAAASVSRDIGDALHTLQDFFSHTDWVEGTNMAPVYGTWGDVMLTLIAESQGHQPHPMQVIDLNQLYAGNVSEYTNVISYTGGDYGKLSGWDLHNKYSADEPGDGRDQAPPFGLRGAFNRARQSADLQTLEFIQWAKINMSPCIRKEIFGQ
jgi:RHS repeat-associated protein